jgi:SM-20-related protein
MSPSERYVRIAEALADPGWCILPQFLSVQQVDALAAACSAAWNERAFRPAGVGSGDDWHLRPEVRSDYVLWLEEADASPEQKHYSDELESLRLAINSALYLGLFEFEGHLTVYPPGAFYRRHLDQFRAVGYRKVSCILYLNSDWRAEDGGALRLYTDLSNDAIYQDVYPQGGTLVCFLSNLIYHEVLPATRERMSLTGWFRTRD